jgi:hypothetical protein
MSSRDGGTANFPACTITGLCGALCVLALSLPFCVSTKGRLPTGHSTMVGLIHNACCTLGCVQISLRLDAQSLVRHGTRLRDTVVRQAEKTCVLLVSVPSISVRLCQRER